MDNRVDKFLANFESEDPFFFKPRPMVSQREFDRFREEVIKTINKLLQGMQRLLKEQSLPPLC